MKPLQLVAQQSILLERLSSKGKHKYSRYNGLPLRYAGGKSLAVGHIVEYLPSNITSIVSPFFGGGSAEIACARELNIKVKGYDVFDILTNYWQVQIKQPIELYNHLCKWKPTKHKYQQVKERLKAHWDKSNKIDDKISLAAHYWFNHNLSYGPGFLGWMSKIYEDEDRYIRLLDKVRNFTCPKLSVCWGNFSTTMPKNANSFMYCDPPYYLSGNSKMFKGIYPQRNFPVHHNHFDHALLRDLLHKHKGGFILSYNDCETIRDWYSDFEIIEVEWQYTLGQGETRIGKNRMENGTNNHIKNSHELLVLG